MEFGLAFSSGTFSHRSWQLALGVCLHTTNSIQKWAEVSVERTKMLFGRILGLV